MKLQNHQQFSFIITFTKDIFSDECHMSPDIEQIVLPFIQNEYSTHSQSITGTVLYDANTIDVIHRTIIEKSLPIKIAIGRNDSLAQIALLWSDSEGVTLIHPKDEDTYLAGIPIGELPQLSRQHEKQLQKFQIFTAYDIKYSNYDFLKQNCSIDICDLYTRYNEEDLTETSVFDWYHQVQSSSLLEEYTQSIKKEHIKYPRSRNNNTITHFEKINLFNYQSLPSIS